MTAGHAIRLGCPTCGAPLPLEEGARTARCTYCGSQSAIAGMTRPGRYNLNPVLDLHAASQRAIDGLASAGALSERHRPLAHVKDGALFWIPFEWMTATKVGARPPRSDAPGKTGHGIITTDIEIFRPLCQLPGWGLDHVRLDEASGSAGWTPFDRCRAGRLGVVLSPDRTPEPFAPDFGQALVAPRTRILYYPVWRVRYRLHGALYRVVVDAMTGGVLNGRAPEDARYRFWKAAALVALVGLALGQGLRVSFTSGPLGVLLVGLSLLVGLVLAFLAWNLVRFDREIMVDGDTIEVRTLGKGAGFDPEPKIARVRESLSEVSDEVSRFLEEIGRKIE